MTTIAAELQPGPKTARDAVSTALRSRDGRMTATDLVFSEVRQARRQHGLQVAAVTTGLFSVTAAASAAILLGLSA